MGPGSEVFLLAGDGKAKRISREEFPLQGRYGQGVTAWKMARGHRLAGIMSGKASQRATVHYEKAASRQVRLDEAVKTSRTAAGQSVVEVKPGDRLVGLTVVVDALKAREEEKKDAKPKARKPKT
jgi:DNA gyrase/topoisomerase IV subunit A